MEIAFVIVECLICLFFSILCFLFIGSFIRKGTKIYKDLPLEITPKTTQSTQSSIGDEQGSYFDGGLLSLAGWKILGFLITVVTLGFGYPWALCMVYGWGNKPYRYQWKTITVSR